MFINRILEKIRYRRFTSKNIQIGEFVEIDKNTLLEDYCGLAHHASVINSNIGKYTSVGRYSKIRNSVIGRFCSISWDTTIGANSHPIHKLTTHSFPYNKQFGIAEAVVKDKKEETVCIGNDVWIGANSVILSGIHIGDGAIIGAGAVVTKDVPPYAVVGGVPAKVIKFRFDKEKQEILTKLKWWNWNPEKIKANLILFQEENNWADIKKLLLNEESL